jgi:DNA polymerase elongation subunit (family B)
MSGLVSGWSDNDHVYLVSRDDDGVHYRKLPARWSFFIRGVDDADRKTLQRSRDVVGIAEDGHGYLRVDCRSRWARKEISERIAQVIEGANLSRALHDGPLLSAGVYESDVGPLRRVLADNAAIQIGEPRRAYFDIEVDPTHRFDEMLAGKARILAWAITDDAGRKESAVLEEDTDVAERDLLRRFFVVAQDYDLMLAWNGDAFDFPVLELRTSRLKVKMTGTTVPVWQRWCWLDQMNVFKKYNQAHESGEERASFALNAIAHHLLGEGKHDFDARKIREVWESGPEGRERIRRYNEQDAALMPRIEAKTGFVALHVAVCQATRNFPDSDSLGAGAQGDGFLLSLGARRGWRFPPKPYWDDETVHQAFAGAFVMEPKRLGILDYVHVCDFAGLYPSIIRSWNMSPDTFITALHSRGVPHARLPGDRGGVRFRTDKRGIFPEALDQLVAQRAEYTKRADAAEPGSPDWDRFKRLSGAYKIVANSFYGIIGSPFARYFDRTIAEGVTQTGAWLIKHVMTACERADLAPIYGDTDSVFVQGVGEAEQRFEALVAELNAGWPAILAEHGCTENRVKLEYEKSFRRLVLVSAKRYAGRYARWKGKPAPPDMKPEIKGLEYKRGDALRLARELQKEAIDMLLDVSRPAPAQSEAEALVARWRDRVLHGELALEDIVLSQSIKALGSYKERYTSAKCTAKLATKKSCGYEFASKEVAAGVLEKCPRCQAERKRAAHPAHVRVAKVMQERGEQVTEGMRIEYLVVGRPEDDDSDDDKMLAVPAHDPGAFERIDREYYWDKRILPPTERLLTVIYPGRDWKETAAKRRKIAAAAEKEATAKRNRNRIDDLPLFGGSDR